MQERLHESGAGTRVRNRARHGYRGGDPSPGQGEVLIATEAVTVNPADFAVVTGAVAARLPWGSAPPYTPGWDLAGRVVAAGEGVDSSVLGSRVLGFSLWFESLRGTQAARVYGVDDARGAYEAFAKRTGRGRITLSF